MTRKQRTLVGTTALAILTGLAVIYFVARDREARGPVQPDGGKKPSETDT